VTNIGGIEADYDGEKVSFDEAVEIVSKAGLEALIYTSPSHAQAKPRWRVVCFFSSELSPSERPHMLGRLNGLFGGVFAAESWTLSQSYYFGSVNANPTHRVEVIEGTAIDLLDELDEIWIGKPNTKGNGADGQHFSSGPLDEAALREAIVSGQAYHQSCTRIVGLWAQRGVPFLDAQQRLHALFDQLPADDRDDRWKARRADVPRIVRDIYGKEADERDAEEAAFEAWEQQQPPSVGVFDTEPPEIVVYNAAEIFTETLPPRRWLLGNIFCKQFTSSLVGTGGGGKTAVRIAQALSVATGRSLTGEYVHKRCKVLFLSFEDGIDELKRRLLAAMLHHGVLAADVDGWLFFATIRERRLIQTDVRGNRVLGTLEGWLRLTIQQLGVELVILDPFVKTHGVEENDNTGIDVECTLLAQLGIELDVAVDYLHHIRKGTPIPGDADLGRGASAAKDAGRLVYTLTPMSENEGKLFNVGEDQRRRLIRMDSGKVNIAPPAAAAKWFKIVGVRLGNGTPDYPHGDEVQTIEPWGPPDLWKGLGTVTLNAILTEIDQGMPNGRLYSDHPQATDRGAWQVVQKHLPDLNEAQAREIIRTWVKNGVLYLVDYHDEQDRKDRKGLRVNDRKRPG